MHRTTFTQNRLQITQQQTVQSKEGQSKDYAYYAIMPDFPDKRSPLIVQYKNWATDDKEATQLAFGFIAKGEFENLSWLTIRGANNGNGMTRLALSGKLKATDVVNLFRWHDQCPSGITAIHLASCKIDWWDKAEEIGEFAALLLDNERLKSLNIKLNSSFPDDSPIWEALENNKHLTDLELGDISTITRIHKLLGSNKILQSFGVVYSRFLPNEAGALGDICAGMTKNKCLRHLAMSFFEDSGHNRNFYLAEFFYNLGKIGDLPLERLKVPFIAAAMPVRAAVHLLKSKGRLLEISFIPYANGRPEDAFGGPGCSKEIIEASNAKKEQYEKDKENMKNPLAMFDVPKEILQKIAGYLGPTDISAIGMVKKELSVNEVAETPYLHDPADMGDGQPLPNTMTSGTTTTTTSTFVTGAAKARSVHSPTASSLPTTATETVTDDQQKLSGASTATATGPSATLKRNLQTLRQYLFGEPGRTDPGMLSINGSSCKQMSLQVPGPDTPIGTTLLSLDLPGSLPIDSPNSWKKFANNILTAIQHLSSQEGKRSRIVLSLTELIEKTKKENKETKNLQRAIVSLVNDLRKQGYPVVVLEGSDDNQTGKLGDMWFWEKVAMQTGHGSFKRIKNHEYAHDDEQERKGDKNGVGDILVTI